MDAGISNFPAAIADEVPPIQITEIDPKGTKLKQFSCSECDKAFQLKGDLKRHTLIHTGTKPFTCDLCDKQFTRRFTMTEHMRIHTGDRPFSCTLCNKSFTLKTNLTDHLRTHTGEKPYKCDLCERCFAQKAHLNKHIRTHYGDKPYTCDICNKAFAHRTSMNRHKQKFHLYGNVNTETEILEKVENSDPSHFINCVEFMKQEVNEGDENTEADNCNIIDCGDSIEIKQEVEENICITEIASAKIVKTKMKGDIVHSHTHTEIENEREETDFILVEECIKQELL